MHSRLAASVARSLLDIETPSLVRFLSGILLRDINIGMDEVIPQRLEEVIDEVTRSVNTNTDLDMREFLGINKALTRIKGKLQNNVSKLTKINARIVRKQENVPKGSSDLLVHEERVKAKIADLREESSARLEIISQNRQDLASQFLRM